MRLIKMTGGLGNQMFIYALYLRMKRRYPNTRIDLSDMQHYHVHQGYELHRVFPAAKAEEVVMPQWIKKVLEFLCFRTILERHEHGSLRHYDGRVMWPLVYYKGFYQHLQYLQGIEDEIRKAFAFDSTSISERNRLLVAEMESTPQSVSLHVRRGDYMKDKFYQMIGCVCQLPYYLRAVEEMESHVQAPHYYVFSDDMAWVKENLPLQGSVTFVDWNHGADSWQDMMLMTHCRHHIICNSTFSWWGAWLGKGKGTVVCPDRWYANDEGEVPLYPGSWTRIPTNPCL